MVNEIKTDPEQVSGEVAVKNNLLVNVNKKFAVHGESSNDVILELQQNSLRFEERLKSLDDNIILLSQKADKLEENLVYDKSVLMTILGIFASIVTFFSVEIQIFKNICDPNRLVGFSFGLLASLLTFVLALHWVAITWMGKRQDTKTKEDDFSKNTLICLISLIVGLVALGGWFFGKGKDELSCKENVVFERYSADFDQRQVDMERQIKKIRTLIDQ